MGDGAPRLCTAAGDGFPAVRLGGGEEDGPGPARLGGVGRPAVRLVGVEEEDEAAARLRGVLGFRSIFVLKCSGEDSVRW